MSICQCRKRLVFLCEFGKGSDGVDQFLSNQLQRLTHDNDVGVIAYITGSRAQVNDALRIRTLLTISVDVAHDVMSDFFFSRFCNIVVDVVLVLLQLVNLFLGDGKTQFFFRLCQSDPEPSPSSEFHVG